MSGSKTEQAAKKEFTCRNIKKEFIEFLPSETVTKDFHLELDEDNDVIVVEDRPVDWAERANKDADKVGIANIINTIQRQGLDIRSICAFKDSEALDLSELDPMNPHAYQDSVNAQKKAMSELEATAARMGVTVDSLIKAAISGNVEQLEKVQTAATSTEEGK